MSSTSKGRKDEQVRERRKGKFEKLVQQAEHGTPSDYQVLADFLTDEQDFEQLTRLLGPLRLSMIPSTPLDTSNLTSMAQSHAGRQSIETFPLFFRVLRHAPRQSPALRAYHEKCLQMMLDRWGAVIAWMAFLLLHAPQGEANRKVQEACAQALLQILSDPENSPSRQEIASMRGTADIVYVLLSQVDERKKYYVLRPDGESNPKAACLLTELFKCMFDSMPGWDAMEAKLAGMKKWKRMNMVQAFIGRAQQLVTSANIKNITGIAISLEYLLQGIFSLCPNRQIWDLFQRTEILFDCGAALTELASKARFLETKDWECWQAISSSVFHLTYAILNCSMNPTQEVPALVRCGIMRTAMMCLPALKVNPDSRISQDMSNQWKDAIQALDMIAPYFFLERAFRASFEHGDFHFHQDLRTVFLNPTESSRIVKMAQMSQGPAEAIWRGYLRLYTQAKQAHIDRTEIPISLCGNPKHVDRYPNLPEMPVKACGKCRSILYCSRECQVEDWERFHRRECGFAAVRVQALRIPAGTRPFVQMMRDQLRHLESAATEYDLVEQVRRSRSMMHRNQRKSNATFPSLDFSAMHRLPYTRTGTSAGLNSNPNNPHAATSNAPHVVATHDDSCGRTTVSGNESPDAGEWERRYKAYVNEATLEPEKVVLIEGVFRYAEIDDVTVRVLAKMRVGGKSGTEKGVGKYRVVGSLFKIG